VLLIAQPPVSEVFDMVTLSQIVPICSTEAEALATVALSAA
jgi:hypothetical protein